MKRADARMIAEELYKLMKQDGQIEEKWLASDEAAEFLHVSKDWMKRNGKDLPRSKVGGSFRYPQSKLNAYMNK